MTADRTTAGRSRITGLRRKKRYQEYRNLTTRRQLLLQALCLFVALTVLFPIIWVVSLSLDPRGLASADGLNLFPPGANLVNYFEVIERPTSNPVTFWQLAFNSLLLAVGAMVFSVALGVSAAYAFSRLSFRGRNVLIGGSGNDILAGEGGADILAGFRGSDYIDGGIGRDRCSAEFRASCERGFPFPVPERPLPGPS